MQEIADQIQRIESKLQQLLKEYHSNRKELQRLQKENQLLNQQLQEKTTLVNDLTQKIDVLKMTTNGLSDSKDLEKRINSYLKEIDKCLAMLHS